MQSRVARGASDVHVRWQSSGTALAHGLERRRATAESNLRNRTAISHDVGVGTEGLAVGQAPEAGSHADGGVDSAAGDLSVFPDELRRIRNEIRAATEDPAGFSIACRLLVEDTGDSQIGDDGGEGRLEHAVARATLDAWLRGRGTGEDVGRAYAALGDCLSRVASRARADSIRRLEEMLQRV
jgi:hypothetical protein